MNENGESPKEVPINESYDFLRRSMDNLNDQQSSGSAPPELYPSVNNQGGQQELANSEGSSTGHDEGTEQKH